MSTDIDALTRQGSAVNTPYMIMYGLVEYSEAVFLRLEQESTESSLSTTVKVLCKKKIEDYCSFLSRCHRYK